MNRQLKAMSTRVFVSYRRDDAAGDAGRLADYLQRRFGAAQVFLDIETIEPGADFVRVLQQSLQQTAVMLVVIGPRWTSLPGPDGSRRLHDPADFVRMEVEAALTRDIPVVPVLVQGATLPRKGDLPPSLVPLITRQVFVLDHAEFNDDARRLGDRLAKVIEGDRSAGLPPIRRWWPALGIVVTLAVGITAYVVSRKTGPEPHVPPAAVASASAPASAAIEPLLAEASAQRRRNQAVEALVTLARARELAPGSEAVRRLQEEVAMEWIRGVRVESGKSSFGEAIKPALAVIDASLPGATGQRRADLLAHSGWATFLMWRDGDRRLNPVTWYDEARSLDPANPYANAMLAHWTLFQGDDVTRAAKLFETAAGARRALDAVRSLQWSAYGNDRSPEAGVEMVRLADAMRRNQEALSMSRAQQLWAPYYSATQWGRDKERQLLLEAIPPDDHISTLGWAFSEYAAKDESRRVAVRYYVALLHERAGRADRALDELRTLRSEVAPGSLQDAVQAALERLRPRRGMKSPYSEQDLSEA